MPFSTMVSNPENTRVFSYAHLFLELCDYSLRGEELWQRTVDYLLVLILAHKVGFILAPINEVNEVDINRVYIHAVVVEDIHDV